MQVSRHRRFAAILLVSTALGGISQSVAAEPTSPPEAAPQEVVVTGSRIPRINEKSANPVSVVTSQDAKLQGSVHVEDLLNTLPQVNAGLNGGALGPTGTATVDLRGFGAAGGLAKTAWSAGSTSGYLNLLPRARAFAG
ncbi:MAG: TonB-dependent receptor plug domain-containing protein, partial [Gammaproteobacteria bacterium]